METLESSFPSSSHSDLVFFFFLITGYGIYGFAHSGQTLSCIISLHYFSYYYSQASFPNDLEKKFFQAALYSFIN